MGSYPVGNNPMGELRLYAQLGLEGGFSQGWIEDLDAIMEELLLGLRLEIIEDFI